MYPYHNFFSGESDHDCEDCPRELWFGQGSVFKSHQYINIAIVYLLKVTMTVKTAPENSGLVKVQLSNLINISISKEFFWWKWGCCKDCPRELWFGQGSVIKSHKYINITMFYLVKVTMTVKTAPENSGLVKVQLSNLINVSISQFFLGESDDDCKDCPRELWFGQGSGIKSQKCINITIFSGESDDDSKDCPREVWFGQSSVIKSQKCIHITFFLVKVTMTVKAPENSGLVKVQLSNLINISISQDFLWWKWRWL